MEFRYRAGDARNHSSLFPRDAVIHSQHLRGGGFVGGEIGREMHLIPHPMPAMAALRREIQKERIREEIIARDMAERRILEEEVRRELEMEQAMGIRQVPLIDPLVLAHPRTRHHLSEAAIAERILPLSLPHMQEIGYREVELRDPCVSEGRLHEIVPLGEDRISRATKEEAFLLRTDDSQSAVRKPAVEKFLSKPEIPGMKRKSETSRLEPTKKSFGCCVCEVITTCEEHLEKHLTGKKHKAKLAKLGYNDIGSIAKASAPKASASKASASKASGPTASASKASASKASGPKASAPKASAEKEVINLLPANVPKTVSIMVNGKLNQVIQNKRFLRCPPCGVKCNSTMMMFNHLSGKRHAEQVGQSTSDKRPVKTTAATTEDAKSKQLAEAEVKKEDLEDIAEDEELSEEEAGSE